MKVDVPESVVSPLEEGLARVQVVLCGTTHSGNLGAVARAMKNMGLSRLVLVAPKADIDEQALATAKHAADILHAARIVTDLDTALADSVAVWATSARVRDLHLPVSDMRTAARSVWQDLSQGAGQVSILFGAERTGLTNQELVSAHRLIEIPANPAYPVLNLGQAVQIVAYELRMACREAVAEPSPPDDDWATMAELTAFERRLAAALDHTAFFVRGDDAPDAVAQNRKRLLSRIQIFFRRARPTRNELAILQGMLSALTTDLPSDKNTRHAS